MNNKWTGWTGKFLRVNLTTGKVVIEDDDPEIMKTYIGGLGVGIKYMLDEVDPKVDAFNPKNKLMFITGPLTGVALFGNRLFVETKSPLTGGIANAAVGGYFGAELKFAGYDFIIFEGKAKHPVYLWIENDDIEIRSAEHLWGKGTQETEDIVLSETDELAHIASIGPAGEKLARLANVIMGGAVAARAAGRGGIGAVMGSKNLKAVAVRGTKGLRVADKEAFKKAEWEAVMKNVVQMTPTAADLRNVGTVGAALEFTNSLGILPTRNFQTGVFEGAHKIGGEVLAETYSARGRFGKACFGCPIGCSRLVVVKQPGFEVKAEGPEYESVNSLGSVCGVDNLPVLIKAAYICADMGLDTISMGVTIGCAMELYEKGYLPEKDIGYKLNFGNAEAVVDLVEKTSSREGFGWILGEGSYRLADKYGHPELSMTAKKLELPNYDPRGVKGLGLAFITNNRGADHCRAETNIEEQWQCQLLGYATAEKECDRFALEGKAEMTKTYQDYCAAAFHSPGQCYFSLIDTPPQAVVDLLGSATGVDIGGVEGLKKKGERIFNLERLFNLKAGLTSADDTLPKRFLKEPLPEGPSKGHIFEQDKLLPEYYRVRGWNDKGVPTPEKLKELGISVQ